MNDCPVNVNRCFTLGHIYGSTLLTRCTHTESYVITGHVFQDLESGETISLYETTISFGPFDTMHEVSDGLAEVARRVARVVQVATP